MIVVVSKAVGAWAAAPPHIFAEISLTQWKRPGLSRPIYYHLADKYRPTFMGFKQYWL